jgi:hypothetical protein
VRVTAKTAEGRLRVKAVLTARKHGHDAGWVRAIAHEMWGVPSTEGLSLTVLDVPQLNQLVDEVVRRTGGTPGEHRRGKRGDWNPQADGVTKIASLAQHHLIEGLRRDLHLSEAELIGVIHQATHGRASQVKTQYEARVTIEALWAMQERRKRQEARTTEPQRSEPQQESENDQ